MLIFIFIEDINTEINVSTFLAGLSLKGIV